MTPACTHENCTGKHYARGMCQNHYARWHHRERVAKDPTLLKRYQQRKSNRKFDPRTREIDFIARRRSSLRRDFGITLETYQRMLETQSGGCAICGGHDGEKCLAVDHCHVTLRVRGLLCQNCNQALGKMSEDPARLRAAATYLESVLHDAARDAVVDVGANRRGKPAVNRKLSAEQVRQIRASAPGTSFEFANYDAVSRIKRGKIYRWVE